ncbi:MAG: arginine--tRNA ligase [Candidatus Aenigmarchaeota archaeon]|nr:arginine--tRNA ligase [Candidatus Aenigmarchaeota archaeon]
MYVIEKFQRECEELVEKVIGRRVPLKKPSEKIDADLCLPCFSLGKDPKKVAEKLTEKIKSLLKKKRKALVGDVRAIGSYVNFYINLDRFTNETIKEVLKMKDKYGSGKRKNEIILIDYSSPNIAKPMSVGHLRSTIIGQALYNIFSFLGYRCIGDNHLGDIGTQFGKLIAAYKLWGNRERIKKDPIRELLNLYVKFHKEVERNKDLEDLAKEWSKKLERSDKEAVRLWKWFIKLSKGEFEKIYRTLGVRFDLQLGESFYIKMAKDVVEEALEESVATVSDGAVIIPLDKFNLPPLVIRRADGATLYAARDLAAIKHRMKEFNPKKILYVVGSEQKLYFRQLFKAAEMLGYTTEDRLIHVDFGLVRLGEGKMSTRKGRVVFLEDVINKAISLAGKIIEEKNPKLKKKKEVAKIVGVGSIIFNDLKQDRTKNIRFDWNKMLSFEGDACPYIQYVYVRGKSIIEKYGKPIKYRRIKVETEVETRLMRKLAEFPTIIKEAAHQFKPHTIAQYLLDLTTMFNIFYTKERIIGSGREDELILLVWATMNVVKVGLNLLGIKVPERM